MRGLACILLIASSLFCVAQEGRSGLKKPQVKPAASAGGAPVSQAEARATFAKVEALLAKAIRSKKGSSPAIPQGSGPVSRAHIVAEMSRLFDLCKPQFKFTPRKVALEPRPLKLNDQRLKKLIEWGCVAKVGPVAVGPRDTFSVAEFGDAVGFFIARMAQLTHLPSPKWTPALGLGSG